MKIVKVVYTAKAEFVSTNQHNIQQVMHGLKELNHPGILYHTCLGADGQTFTHTAFFKEEEDQKILLTLRAFKTFEQQLKASGPLVPPKQELLTLVGVSKDIFG
jgi:hypothetical protein